MDKNLLTLWQAVPSGDVKKEKIVEVLGLSAKQASRHIQKWTLEGWLTYIPGRGRGNVSKLQWLKNVEELYEAQLMEIIEQEAVEISSKYLLFDWSANSKTRLLNKFRLKFGFFQHTNKLDKLIIPKKHKVVTMHPLKAADIQSANVVANIFNRLVAVDADGHVFPELAHSWDVSSTRLRMYLKKDVKFHDDSILTAADVVHCLNRLRTDIHFNELWKPGTEIRTPAPLVVDFHFPEGCSYCIQMLGLMNSSIYKENKGEVVGTGSFYADNSHDLKTVLHAFKDYFGERPLLDRVEFVQVPGDFDFVYRSRTQCQKEDMFLVESDSGVGVVIMNAFRNSDICRKEVRDYLHWVIAKYRHEIHRFYDRALPNSQSMLVGQSHTNQIPDVKRPAFTNPIRIKTTDYLEKPTCWIQYAFEKEGIPFEVQYLPFEKMIFDNGTDQQADLFIRGEVFEMNQNFSFFHFLKNGYSPLANTIQSDETLARLLDEYVHTPFEEWTALNLKMEGALMDASVLIPLYYEKRQIPFSADLMNITISHFGYVDFSKLWVRPAIEE